MVEEIEFIDPGLDFDTIPQVSIEWSLQIQRGFV